MLLSLLTAAAVGFVASMLSPYIVARRWAFLGEGVGHSGFGGAGIAWLLLIAFPWLDSRWLLPVMVTAACLTTALLVAAASRRGHVHTDSATGAFLVATVALGFFAQRVYVHYMGAMPADWETILMGANAAPTPAAAMATVAAAAAVVFTLVAFQKELIAYAYDPELAEASGIRTGLMHYTLAAATAVTVIMGLRLTGGILITALLVLPGATANLLTRTQRGSTLTSVTLGTLATAAGVAASGALPLLPAGPAIVAILFLAFVSALVAARIRGK